MTRSRGSQYDVVVVGGGAAGLSAALTLARSRRSVVVVDAGEPRNAPADGVHGFLTRDGLPPRELTSIGRREVVGYGGEVLDGRVTAATRDGDRFAVALADGQVLRARRLLVTTGLVDELPDVPGLRERWGRDVLHCPYCHGWEVRDEAVGVLATGPFTMHQALLFRQLTDDVTVLVHAPGAADLLDAERLAARDVRVATGPVASLLVEDDRLVGVRLADGDTVPLHALVVAPRFVARSVVLAQLGVAAAPHPSGIAEHVPADPTGRTTAPGVWVAGNVTDPSATVVTAAAAGFTAAAGINADLVEEDVLEALAGRARLVG